MILFYLGIAIFMVACSNQRMLTNVGEMDPVEGLDIYLLIGQSNMAGRGLIEQPQNDTLENVYLFTGDGWELAANPLNKYSTVRKDLSIQKLGLGYSFAKKLEKCTGKKIGLVVNARGGTRIEWWRKGYIGKNDFDLYEQAVLQTKKAIRNGRLKGIIWHQGEGNQGNSDNYMPQLEDLVGDLRKDLGIDDVFFVAGELGKWRSSSIKINTIIRTIPQKIKYASFVSTDSLTPLRMDSTDPHFDTRSQMVLGKRYADEVLKHVYHLKSCED